MSSSVSCLSPAQLRRDLAIRDLSDPAQGPHAIQTLVARAVDSLARAWNCDVRWCRGERIVPVADNYDRLGYPAGAISRDARYTRYVDAARMLRSQSIASLRYTMPGQTSSTSSAGSAARRRSAGGTMALDWLRSMRAAST